MEKLNKRKGRFEVIVFIMYFIFIVFLKLRRWNCVQC